MNSIFLFYIAASYTSFCLKKKNFGTSYLISFVFSTYKKASPDTLKNKSILEWRNSNNNSLWSPRQQLFLAEPD